MKKKYNETRQELLEQKEDLKEILDNDEIKLPKPAQTMIKGGAVVTTGLLGGMATGWGAKNQFRLCLKLQNQLLFRV